MYKIVSVGCVAINDCVYHSNKVHSALVIKMGMACTKCINEVIGSNCREWEIASTYKYERNSKVLVINYGHAKCIMESQYMAN